MIVARKPIVIEIRAPWTVRLSMSRPRSSVPRMWAALGGSSAVAGGGRGRLERPDEEVRERAPCRTKTRRIARPTTPSVRLAKRRAKSRALRARSRQRSPRTSIGTLVALTAGPAGRAGRR